MHTTCKYMIHETSTVNSYACLWNVSSWVNTKYPHHNRSTLKFRKQNQFIIINQMRSIEVLLRSNIYIYNIQFYIAKIFLFSPRDSEKPQCFWAKLWACFSYGFFILKPNMDQMDQMDQINTYTSPTLIQCAFYTHRFPRWFRSEKISMNFRISKISQNSCKSTRKIQRLMSLSRCIEIFNKFQITDRILNEISVKFRDNHTPSCQCAKWKQIKKSFFDASFGTSFHRMEDSCAYIQRYWDCVNSVPKLFLWWTMQCCAHTHT